jgi:hypothetical protein
MLSQKRSSRIDAKQKKLLAMLEEETVIDDPKAKAVLVGYKKLEVCKCAQMLRSYMYMYNAMAVL